MYEKEFRCEGQQTY